MAGRTRIQQYYGYAVCLVALIAVFVAVPNMIHAAISRMDPVEAGQIRRGPNDPSLTSFEAYQATSAGLRGGVRQQGAPASDTVPTAELRRRYEVLRADLIAHTRFQSAQDLVVGGVVAIIGLVLFVTHWRWLQRLERTEESAGPQ